MPEMIPNSKPKASRDDVIDFAIDSGLWKDRTVTRCTLHARRGYYLNSMGEPDMNDRGIYDDSIFILSPDTFTSFNANTDPSKYRKGIAKLVAPQKVTYRLGYHGYNSRYGHLAFRQAGPVKITRDGDDEIITDAGEAWFWINLHKGGWRTTSSAGCQTVPPTQWDAFYNLAKIQMDRYNQDTINYYLTER